MTNLCHNYYEDCCHYKGIFVTTWLLEPRQMYVVAVSWESLFNDWYIVWMISTLEKESLWWVFDRTYAKPIDQREPLLRLTGCSSQPAPVCTQLSLPDSSCIYTRMLTHVWFFIYLYARTCVLYICNLWKLSFVVGHYYHHVGFEIWCNAVICSLIVTVHRFSCMCFQPQPPSSHESKQLYIYIVFI